MLFSVLVFKLEKDMGYLAYIVIICINMIMVLLKLEDSYN